MRIEIDRRSSLKREKHQFATLVVDLMIPLTKYKQATRDEQKQMFLNILGKQLHTSIPKLTELYKSIASQESNFIYKQELLPGSPELIVGLSIMLAFDNIINLVEDSLGYKIASDEFRAVVEACKSELKNH